MYKKVGNFLKLKRNININSLTINTIFVKKLI